MTVTNQNRAKHTRRKKIRFDLNYLHYVYFFKFDAEKKAAQNHLLSLYREKLSQKSLATVTHRSTKQKKLMSQKHTHTHSN